MGQYCNEAVREEIGFLGFRSFFTPLKHSVFMSVVVFGFFSLFVPLVASFGRNII